MARAPTGKAKTHSTPSHIALQLRFLATVPVGEPLETRRRHLTCVHPRTRWRATPRGKQRRTRHRRMTTVSSTSSFCRRRRRRRLIGRQTAGRGTTFGSFGSGCGARRAASAPSYLAPSPPHQLHSSRAHSEPSVGRCRRARAVGVRAQLFGNARRSMGSGWEPLRPPSSRLDSALIAAFQFCMRWQPLRRQPQR